MAINVFLAVMISFVLLLFIMGKANSHRNNQEYMNQLLKNFGSKNNRKYDELTYQNISQFAKINKAEYDLDDISWNDLDMDEIYRQMNYCHCSAGDEYLYYLLRNLKFDDNEADKFEKTLSYFGAHPKERAGIQLILHRISYTGKYSIWQYLGDLNKLGKRSSFKIYLSYLFLFLSFILCFYKIHYGLILAFFILLFNLIRYFKEKDDISIFLSSFAYILRILYEIKNLKAFSDTEYRDEIHQLLNVADKFRKFQCCSFLLMSSGRSSGNPLDIIMDYLRMFLHLDILKFNLMYNELDKYRDEIEILITLIGKIDAELSILEYRAYLGNYCIPKFVSQKYEARNLYHPLIEHPVSNDLVLSRSILVTGSNASGKSTFLKTVAINTIFAQSIHTVCGDSYEADFYRVYTSLSLKDNLFKGDSYYMAEIKAIKRMLDAAENKGFPTLVFVDEVLRGTNTVERIAASSQILKEIAMYPGFCLAATHDIELTEILNNIYENVHFEEEMREGDIHFPYRLLKGKSTTRNAISLLSMLGYDQTLVEEATKSALSFELNGKWDKI